MTSLFPIDPIEFECAPPVSKKNNTKVINYGGHYSISPTDEAIAQERALREFLQFELAGLEVPHFGYNDVGVSVDYQARTDNCIVRIEDLGPKPKGFTGRQRDLANLLDIILDAMHGKFDRVARRRLPGPVYWDDNQVAQITMRRLLT